MLGRKRRGAQGFARHYFFLIVGILLVFFTLYRCHICLQMACAVAMTSTVTHVEMRAAGHAQRVLSTLNQQRAAGSFCDALLKVTDGVVYAAHRSVLACFSQIFQNDNMATASPSVEFCLQECSSEGLELLLDFVYTGELKLDPSVLDKVQSAASSLCVPEALAMCHRFRDKPRDAVPLLKRGRGRPRKTNSEVFSISGDEPNKLTVAKEQSVLEGVVGGVKVPATATTRSGRVVKGPRRMISDEDTACDVLGSVGAPPHFSEREHAEDEDQNTEQPTGQTQINKLPSHINDTGAVEDETDSLERTICDSDEEYIPTHKSSTAAASPPISRRCRRSSHKSGHGETAEGESSVRCPVCHKVFKSKYYLKVHNRRHTGEKPFGCHKCGKHYFRKENLLIHELRHCTATQTFTCRTCSSSFKDKEELRAHVVSHVEQMPYKCSQCAEQFMYKKHLMCHMMKVHGYPKPHACPQCPKTFWTRYELRVHEASKHRGEKPFVCEECGHRASSRNGLQMHIKAIHRNERPFLCSICGHAFSQKNNLNMHLRVHSGEKPYQCHLCGKTFRTQASLEKHHRTHTGERPFPCDVCDQRFTEKGALLRHKASKHEEGRPHCCHICNKTFKAKEQLRVHLRRHKGMRKFECDDCGYKFTRQAHLRRHVQIHKRTENYNPRQRKLRNVVVDEHDGGPGDFDATKPGEATPVAVEAVGAASSGMGSSCVVTVVIE
ncbi:telomere zinc finger-associated protein isoform X2 [Phyllopteryx taeniolatus]|uniref:telomere zinc finger-associated protein isoform X2 n=1 Tax=Phyllopteryx taeniolatus TaxID=161469 RepID=UPI002AD4E714|nr:telomere zinc finger-associated protein isoform X2 [Phyllopteryx taeniolatus]